MDDITREMFLMHAETPEYIAAITHSNNIIIDALSRYKKQIVSFSGGKDSLVMAHLVTQHTKDIHIFHWDYGRYYVPWHIEAETLRIMNWLSPNTLTATSPQYEVHKRTPANIFYRSFFGSAIKKLKALGFDLQFIGLREQESLRRKRKLNGNPFRKDTIDECHPVHLLTWKDVWAYILVNDLPYLQVYDKYAALVGYDKVRFATFFDSEFDKLGASNIDGILMPEFKHPK